jgi:hypothetical protein
MKLLIKMAFLNEEFEDKKLHMIAINTWKGRLASYNHLLWSKTTKTKQLYENFNRTSRYVGFDVNDAQNMFTMAMWAEGVFLCLYADSIYIDLKDHPQSHSGDQDFLIFVLYANSPCYLEHQSIERRKCWEY